MNKEILIIIIVAIISTLIGYIVGSLIRGETLSEVVEPVSYFTLDRFC